MRGTIAKAEEKLTRHLGIVAGICEKLELAKLMDIISEKKEEKSAAARQ